MPCWRRSTSHRIAGVTVMYIFVQGSGKKLIVSQIARSMTPNFIMHTDVYILVHKFSKCSANDAKLHTAYSAFQDATNPSIVDSHFVQGHQEIPPKTRNQTKWLIELCTLRQEMESDASNATMRESFSLVSLVIS